MLILILPYTNKLYAQAQIELPKEIRVEVNDIEKNLTAGWIDSLIDDAYSGAIHYKILGAKRFEYYITTHIQIPQILSIDEVLRQIVIYYALLPDEDAREREILNIFQYFESTIGEPAIKANYSSDGEFDINIYRWSKVPIPDPPIPEDKDLFNQIIQSSFKDVQSLGEVPDQVFEKVAVKNNLSIERIKIIYQNTILWQVSTHIARK